MSPEDNKTLYQWLTKCEYCTWPARNANGGTPGKYMHTKAGQFCHMCQNTTQAAVPSCELEK
jgi:hypothetical protein